MRGERRNIINMLNNEMNFAITGHEPITVSFSDEMKSCTVSGTMGDAMAESNLTWDDTKTYKITPAAGKIYPEGSGQGLVLNCTSVDGKTVNMSFTFTTEYAVYVRLTDSSNSNAGTKTQPRESIQSAVNWADSLYENAVVRVAKGTYTSDYNSTNEPVIDMKVGISVSGGYTTDFESYDTIIYETILEDTSSGGGGGTLTANRVVSIGSGITSAIVLSGFTIKTAKLGHCAGIFCDSSSPTISDNTIIGSADSDSTGDIYGIIANNAAPTISNNIIFYEWNDPKSNNSYGVYLTGSSSTPIISNNTIYGGRAVTTIGIYDAIGATISNNKIYANTSGTVSGNTLSYAINVDNTSSSIENNDRIDCGKGTNLAIGIRVFGTSSPVINSNVISNENLTTNAAFAIYETATDSDPSSVSSNDFDGFFGAGATNTAYYFDNSHPVDPQIINFATTIYNAASNTLTGWGNTSTFTSN